MSQVSDAEQSVSVAPGNNAIADLIIHGNLHILLVALGLMLGTYLFTEASINIYLLMAGCCGACLVYQIDRIFVGGEEDPINHPERTAWLKTHKLLVNGLFALFLAIGLWSAIHLQIHTIGIGAGLAIIGVVYLFPILPGRVRPKSIWFVKPVMISGAWVAGTVLFPAWDAKIPLDVELLGLVFYRWFFILPNVLLSDWPDRAGDMIAGHTSVATMLDERQLRFFAGLSAVIALGFGLFVGLHASWSALFYADLIGPMLMLYVCSRPMIQAHGKIVLGLDLIVAWPAVVVFMYWLIG